MCFILFYVNYVHRFEYDGFDHGKANLGISMFQKVNASIQKVILHELRSVVYALALTML